MKTSRPCCRSRHDEDSWIEDRASVIFATLRGAGRHRGGVALPTRFSGAFVAAWDAAEAEVAVGAVVGVHQERRAVGRRLPASQEHRARAAARRAVLSRGNRAT